MDDRNATLDVLTLIRTMHLAVLFDTRRSSFFSTSGLLSYMLDQQQLWSNLPRPLSVCEVQTNVEEEYKIKLWVIQMAVARVFGRTHITP